MESRIEDDATAAKLAVEAVGPRVYKLTGFNGNRLRFFVMGCQGSGKKTQEQVAKLMNKIALESGEVAFVLVLGDNIYDYGAASPLKEFESGFDTCFYQFYANPKYKGLYQLPFFLILGNHDANRHKKAHYQPWMAQGETVEINQTAHNYLPEGERYPDVASKQKLFEQADLPLDELGKWNMPYHFYSIIAGDTQLFCLNANTLARDFLDWKNGKTIPGKINQIAWLHEQYKKAQAEGLQVMIALHNPLKTVGKRAFPNGYDTGNYLNQEQVAGLSFIFQGCDLIECLSPPNLDELRNLPITSNAAYVWCGDCLFYINKANQQCIEIPLPKDGLRKFKEMLQPRASSKTLSADELNKITRITGHSHAPLKADTQSYNELLRLCFADLCISPKIFFTAHDHAMTYYNDLEEENGLHLCQVGSGGGGGDLQKRKFFSGTPYLPCYLKNNGFVSISCDLKNPKENLIEYFTTAGHYLKFLNLNHHPVRNKNTNPAVEHLRELALESCLDYFEKKPNTAGGSKSMLGYFSSGVGTLTHYLFSNEDLPEEIDCIHNIMAYFNHPDTKDIRSVMADLKEMMEKLADKKSDSSFVRILERHLLAHENFPEREDFYHALILNELDESLLMAYG